MTTAKRSPRIVYLVKRAETVVRGQLEACLQPLVTTPRQYVTLSLLSSERDQSAAELARKAGITPQSITETIAALTSRGLIERKPGQGRMLMTRLTASGEALLAECEIAVDAVEARMLTGVSASDVDALRLLLLSIIKSPGQGASVHSTKRRSAWPAT